MPPQVRLHEIVKTLVADAKSPAGALLIGLIGVALAVYATWFNDKRVSLSLAVHTNSSLVSELAPSPSLELVFNGTTFNPARTPLRVLLVRIWNDGDTTIRANDFDPQAPIGFRVQQGRFLYADLEQASTEYLKSSAKVSLSGQDSVAVAPVILEPGDAVFIKALLLHESGQVPVVKPMGKVAGATSVTELFPVSRIAGRVEGYISSTERLWNVLGVVAIALLAAGNFGYSLIQAKRRKQADPNSSAPSSGTSEAGRQSKDT